MIDGKRVLFRVWIMAVFSTCFVWNGDAFAKKANLTGYYGEIFPMENAKVPAFTDVTDMSQLKATLVEVHVFKHGNLTCIDWMITRNPTGRILEGISPAVQEKPGQILFQFQDVWGNKGNGSFFLSGQNYMLDMRVNEPAILATDTIGIYGDYLLKIRSPSPNREKHVWSLGDNISCPDPS